MGEKERERSERSSSSSSSYVAQLQQRERQQQQFQTQALLATIASQTVLQKMGQAFWDAFSGSSSPAAGNSSAKAWDSEKVQRVLDGRAVLRVVDVPQRSSPASSTSTSTATALDFDSASSSTLTPMPPVVEVAAPILEVPPKVKVAPPILEVPPVVEVAPIGILSCTCS